LLHISQDSEERCAAGMQPSELLHIFEGFGLISKRICPREDARLKDPPQTERQSLAIQDHHMLPPKFTGFKLAKMCRLRPQTALHAKIRASFPSFSGLEVTCSCCGHLTLKCSENQTTYKHQRCVAFEPLED
jgi:hypothetical protein